MKILTFGTYPIRNPKHGGQRRVAALARQHRSQGHQVLYVAAYPAGAYGSDDVSTLDLQVTTPDTLGGGWASDLASGKFCAENDLAFSHFSDICSAFEPDAISLEQPFLWPTVERLLSLPAFDKVKVIYSSHNVEAQLKHNVLTSAGVPVNTVKKIVKATEDVERSLLARADLVIAVSHSDAQEYRRLEPTAAVVVRPNGIDAAKDEPGPRPDHLPNPYIMFVGSAHLPNREGFLDLVLGDGLQFLPPEKSLAVVGGVADLIYTAPAFQRRIVSNCDRVHFFAQATDEDLTRLIQHASGFVLPILTGGGTNLKTAEALFSGKWVIGTDAAFRGYEDFRNEPNVLIANTRPEFIEEIRKVRGQAPAPLTAAAKAKRQKVLWSNVLDGFDVETDLATGRSGRLAAP